MTIEELEQEIAGRKVIRHGGVCFFNVYSDEERDHFQSLRAGSRPFPRRGDLIGHEVFLLGMLDPMIEGRKRV